MEPFTVKTDTETWTRNTRRGAIALADNIARVRGETATVEFSVEGIPFHWAFAETESDIFLPPYGRLETDQHFEEEGTLP